MCAMSNDKILGVEVAGPRESVKWARQKFEECMSGLKEITSNEALADKLCALNAVPDITDPSTLGSVILAQLALTKLGYRPGTIDGLYRNSGAKTSKTMAAVEKFQTDKGLTASGRVDAETLATLAEALRSTAIVVGSDTRRGVSPAAEPVAPVPLTAPPVPRVMSESLPPAPAVRTASVTTKTNNAAVAVGELDPGHETTLGLTVSVNIPPASGNQGVDTRVETQYTPEQNYRIGESIILGNGNMEDARRGMKFLETAAKA